LTGLFIVIAVSIILGRRLQTDNTQQMGAALWGLVGALLVYNYFELGLPGTAVFTTLGSWAGLLTTVLGGIVGTTLYTVASYRLALHSS
ncbi:MAG: hypothetical protein KC413_05915, partial [Anaerolineales bacterium]|nr:hypothetical protein [Anaerolineales bacterium]